MKAVRIFQDLEGNECDVLCNAEYQGYTISLYTYKDSWAVDGTRFRRTLFGNLEDALSIFNEQRMVVLAKRFGTYETSFPPANTEA